MSDVLRCDLAIVGGGLAGGLIAYALAQRRPDLDILLLEEAKTLGGNHIWSFFDTDVDAQGAELLAPIVVHRWAGHDVAFPSLQRTLAGGYASMTSERFDAVLRDAVPVERILCGIRVKQVAPRSVVIDGGRQVVARAVIDARGPADLSQLTCGWQKFVGRLFRLRQPSGLTRPIIMDATIEQIDGFRFMYVLPFGPDRLFIEDTYYSDTPDLDRASLAGRIDGYAVANGWQVSEVEQEEQGVLPVVMEGHFEGYWHSCGGGAKAGARAGLFHPMTGYSLPDAVKTALHIAALPDPAAPDLHEYLHRLAERRWAQGGFARMLGRMLFRAASPSDRWRVLEHFYRLDASVIARFYAGHSTLIDKARILAGRPPVPISRALSAMMAGRR
jgi:lycopene beta-cyclase